MFISVNSVSLYYEKSGTGSPLIMLHGNGGCHKVFNSAIDILKKYYTVYAIDFRNHGQSTKVKNYSYSDHVDDVYEFIKALKIEHPVLYGFSDGGIVGIMLASKYPELLNKLIASGPNITPDGVRPLFTILWKFNYILTRSPNLKLMLNEPNITDEQLSKIKIPVFITGGSSDIIKTDHLKLIKNKIKNSTLDIFPGESHSSYISNSKKIAEYIIKIKYSQ